MPKKEFTLRNLRELSKRFNEDPSLIEEDWRQPFYETFELTAEQREVLDELEAADNGKANLRIQDAFREAPNAARNGGRLKLRVTNDLDLNRRVLRLEVARKLAEDEETLPPEELPGAIAIVCCCADCRCWHWCGTRPNPCPTC